MGIKMKMLQIFDLFGQNICLRYRQQNTYHTLTGCICSLLIFIGFSVIIIQDFILTINKTQISSQISTK